MTTLVPAVAAVVFDEEDRVCLVRDTKRGQWTLPMGRIEPRESVRDTLAREVREEAGLTVESAALAGVYSAPETQVFDTPDGETHYLTHVFRCADWTGSPTPDGEETTAVEFFPVGDYPNNIAPADDWVDHALAGSGVEVT
jgi:ADP-ribose pyrophosphatase YjhB (NUDIX family)